VGSTCFLAAGYEQEMLNDFLPANQGLSRRFTYRVWLKDYGAERLIDIYFKGLAEALSDSTDSLTTEVTRSYFTAPAVQFLRDVLENARSQTIDGAQYPQLDRVFAAQAGAMDTLAGITALLIASNKRRGTIGVNSRGVETWAIGAMDVYDILVTMAMQRLGPYAAEAVNELQTIAKMNGWIVNDSWQVPGGAAGYQSDERTPDSGRRSRP
jgi:hypothetical protein